MSAKVENVASKSFDYIIIGGGTAGLVLANRLTEDADRSVLVLEAGLAHINDPNIYMPASYAKVFGNPDYDWAFSTVPQKHSDGTTFGWQRGKGLGGSSNINFYVWDRPPAADIDAWEALGNPGWNWKNFAKYSKKCETFVPPSPEAEQNERLTYDLEYHGTDGPLGLGFCNMRTGWDVILQDSIHNFGLPIVREPMAGQTTGSFMTLSSVDPRTNKRSSSLNYYLEAASRPNLTVLVSAYVNRIVTESVGGEAVATGVEFSHGGATHVAHAGKEVILSAGAIKSPQILELSGIGDPKVLSKIGVPVKVALPAVGTNAQEHLFASVSYELKEPAKYNTLDPLHNPAIAAEQLPLYTQGEGLFTLGCAGLAFAPFESISPRGKALHAELAATVEAQRDTYPPGLYEQYRQQLSLCSRGNPDGELISFPGFLGFPKPPEPGKKYITLAAAINHPFSRGTIHAVSADPTAHPEIDPHYFEEDIDLKTFVDQVKFMRTIAQTAPLRDHLGPERNPGADVVSDEQLAVFIKKYMSTTYHTAGTTAMLPLDKGGVVDPTLKVYHTRNIRVVDLGVVPLHVASHTQTVVYGIAEQAAEIIKGKL